MTHHLRQARIFAQAVEILQTLSATAFTIRKLSITLASS